jgi:hypothetical protein
MIGMTGEEIAQALEPFHVPLTIMPFARLGSRSKARTRGALAHSGLARGIEMRSAANVAACAIAGPARTYHRLTFFLVLASALCGSGLAV